MQAGARHEPTLSRYLSVDERGTGLRATWRPEHGFVNLSLWRDDTCVETFHLRPDEVATFVSFLVQALATAVPEPRPALRLLAPDSTPSSPAVSPTGRPRLHRIVNRGVVALRRVNGRWRARPRG